MLAFGTDSAGLVHLSRTTIRSSSFRPRPLHRVYLAHVYTGQIPKFEPRGRPPPRVPSNTRGEGQILRVRDAARTCTIGGPFGRGPVRIQTQIRLRRPRKHRGYHLNEYVLDHMHIAGPNQWSAEQGRVEPRRPRVAQYTFVPVESRVGSGSARSRLHDGVAQSTPDRTPGKRVARRETKYRSASSTVQPSRHLHHFDKTVPRCRG